MGELLWVLNPTTEQFTTVRRDIVDRNAPIAPLSNHQADHRVGEEDLQKQAQAVQLLGLRPVQGLVVQPLEQ